MNKKLYCYFCKIEVGPPNQSTSFRVKREFGHLQGSEKFREKNGKESLVCNSCFRKSNVKRVLNNIKIERVNSLPTPVRLIRKIGLKVGELIFVLGFLVFVAIWIFIVTHFGGFGL